jgi:hypothetical protein
MLTFDPDPPVRETATKSAASLPDKILSVALRDETVEPAVLGYYASIFASQPVYVEMLVLNASTPDVAFQRKDPPVDAEYVIATQILSLCRRTVVLNRPEGILAANEKLYALHFPELMAETLVTRHIAELRDFMTKLGGEMVVKPLGGRGGEGVFHVHAADRNRNSILEQSTSFGARRAMAQRFLPEVARGDKRILLLEGEVLGALLRVPSPEELRANLHVGGRAERAEVTDADRRIVERIGPRLRADGLFFGNPAQFIIQLKAVLITIVYSFIVTAIIYKLIDVTIGMRAKEKDEITGLDLSQHHEGAYTVLE